MECVSHKGTVSESVIYETYRTLTCVLIIRGMKNSHISSLIYVREKSGSNIGR